MTLTIGGYLTRDGGQSWKKISGEPADIRGAQAPVLMVGAEVASVPAGWTIGIANDGKLHAIDPSTGQWHPLVHQPKPGVALSSATAGPDGSIWAGLSGTYSAVKNHEQSSGLATSHDRGRTWTVFLPDPADGIVFGASYTDANHAYANLSKMSDAGNAVSSGVLVTSDGGKTWTKQQIAHLPDRAVTLPDGSLLGWASPPSAGLAISDDGGKAAVAVPGSTAASRFAKTVDGSYVYADKELTPASYRMSTDGRTWVPVPLPPVGS
jgi:photosystem II stability/assembly factor-like uncharacterized protein